MTAETTGGRLKMLSKIIYLRGSLEPQQCLRHNPISYCGLTGAKEVQKTHQQCTAEILRAEAQSSSREVDRL